jgi:hypothetical protein
VSGGLADACINSQLPPYQQLPQLRALRDRQMGALDCFPAGRAWIGGLFLAASITIFLFQAVAWRIGHTITGP